MFSTRGSRTATSWPPVSACSSAFRKIAVKAFDEPRPYPDPPSPDDDRLAGSRQRSRKFKSLIELVGGTGIAKTMVLGGPRAGQNRGHGQQGAALGAWAGTVRRGRRRAGRIFITRPAFAAAFRSSRRCAKVSSPTVSRAIYGIVNGTCNYILTRMKLEGADFADVLTDAQKLGYAETPPDLDIDGLRRAAQDRHPCLARARLLGGSSAKFTPRESVTCPRLTCCSRNNWATRSSCSGS
ncbi:MAG: hypothetical protein V9H26_08000 [Verrucomicrobiota bacterium]